MFQTIVALSLYCRNSNLNWSFELQLSLAVMKKWQHILSQGYVQFRGEPADYGGDIYVPTTFNHQG